MNLYILFALISLTQSMSIFTSFLSKFKFHSTILKKEVENKRMCEKKDSGVELWGRMCGCMDERKELEMMIRLCSVLS